MSRIADVTAFLRTFAPLELAEEWDNVGFLLGDETRDCARVMTCLTLTPDVATEAIRERANLVVSHHPLLFRPVQRLTADRTDGRMLLELVAANIGVYSPHTGYDSAAEGINRQLAEMLDLHEVRALREVDSSPQTAEGEVSGIGRCGRLPRAVTLRELVAASRAALGVEHMQFVGDADRSVETVAVACGAGDGFLRDAADQGCDVLLTGEARFHACLEARAKNIALLLPGHYATERPAMEHLATVLRERFPDLTAWASTDETDPLQWA